MFLLEIIDDWDTGYPLTLWYVPLILLSILGFASFADARTGRVPNLPLLFGFLFAVAAMAWGAGWHSAGLRLLYAVAAVVGLRVINEAYHRFMGHDAFGFGDAKWTGLAVAGFGFAPVCWAWAIGAWLGLIWMGLRVIWRKIRPTYAGHAYVHFAPFLFLGLVAALYKERLIALFL